MTVGYIYSHGSVQWCYTSTLGVMCVSHFSVLRKFEKKRHDLNQVVGDYCQWLETCRPGDEHVSDEATLGPSNEEGL